VKNLAVLAPLSILAAACGGSASLERPNVLLITLDTTRADHLGCYGYGLETSPNLDRLAEQSVVYEHAISTASWTLPAHAALFTGKFTSSHGARYDPEGPLRLTSGIEGPAAWDGYRARGLSVEERTLAGLLGQAGYATGAVVAGPWMKRVFGLDRGFEHYDDDQVHDVSGRLAEEVTSAALSWLAIPRDGPFFLFLNYYDPHSPFGAPEPFTFRFLPEGRPRNDRRGNLVHLYDGEIRYMDEHLGALFRELERQGLWDDTLVVVTADHGELFGEGGRWGHGEYLSEAELHVPLIVKHPRGEVPPGRRAEPIQTVDVLPLILARAGVPLPAGIQGGARHPICAEAYPLEAFSQDKAGDWRALYDWPVKYVWNSRGRGGLYDVAADPLETVDLSAGQGERARRMDLALQGYLSNLPPPGESVGGDVDAETAEALRNLGYTGN